MKFLLSITTCDERSEVLASTLDSLASTDWVGKPLVVHDTFRLKDKGRSMTDNGRHALTLALAHDWDYLVYCEDDVLFNIHLHHNLQHWSALREPDFLCGMLYQGDPLTLVGKDYALTDATHQGGSQGVVIKRSWLPTLLKQWNSIGGLVDMRIYKNYRKIQQYLYVHCPNLVQHQTAESTWGGNKHTSPTFDSLWKAER